MTGKEIPRNCRRVVKIENPGPTRGGCNQDPRNMFGDFTRDLVHRPRLLIQTHARIAVTFEKALNRDEKIGPDRLRAGKSAPNAPKERCREEEPQRR